MDVFKEAFRKLVLENKEIGILTPMLVVVLLYVALFPAALVKSLLFSHSAILFFDPYVYNTYLCATSLSFVSFDILCSLVFLSLISLDLDSMACTSHTHTCINDLHDQTT